MSQINDIITGWSNLIRDKFNNTNNDEPIRKLKICKECTLITKTMLCNPNKSVTTKDGVIVYGCGCFLPAKVRSESLCPLNKW